MSVWDLIRKKSQKTKDKDEEYFNKILKLGLYKLGESNGHREAIIKLMAPLNLSERKKNSKRNGCIFFRRRGDGRR